MGAPPSPDSASSLASPTGSASSLASPPRSVSPPRRYWERLVLDDEDGAPSEITASPRTVASGDPPPSAAASAVTAETQASARKLDGWLGKFSTFAKSASGGSWAPPDETVKEIRRRTTASPTARAAGGYCC